MFYLDYDEQQLVFWAVFVALLQEFHLFHQIFHFWIPVLVCPPVYSPTLEKRRFKLTYNPTYVDSNWEYPGIAIGNRPGFDRILTNHFENGFFTINF